MFNDIPAFDETPSEANDWIEKNVDPILRRDILSYNPMLLDSNIVSTEFDGFYFSDGNNYTFLLDNKTGKVKVFRTEKEADFALDDKINMMMSEGKKFYFDNKVIIKDNKKFFHVLSQRTSLWLRILSFLPIIKNKVVKLETQY